MTVLITGAGLLGTHVARSLLDQGVGVILYDPNPSIPYIESVVGLSRKLFRIERGDVRDFPRIVDVMLRAGVTRILHTAALVGPSAEEQPSLAFQVNVVGALNLIEAARIRSLSRIVLVSDAAVGMVLGESPVGSTPPVERDGTGPGFGLAHQAATELLARAYQAAGGINIVVCRPCELYGRGRYTGGGVAGAQIQGALWSVISDPTGEVRLDIPTQERAYVKDVALGVREAIFVERPTTRVYHFGVGELISADQLAGAIAQVQPGARVLSTASENEAGPLLDDSAARRDLGYQPHWSLDDAVKDYATELRTCGIL